MGETWRAGTILFTVLWSTMGSIGLSASTYIHLKDGQLIQGYPVGRSGNWVTWYVYDQGGEVEHRIAAESIRAIVFSSMEEIEDSDLQQLDREWSKRQPYLDLLPEEEYKLWVDYVLEHRHQMRAVDRVLTLRKMRSAAHSQATRLLLAEVEVPELIQLELLDEALAVVMDLGQEEELAPAGESFVAFATATIQLALLEEKIAADTLCSYIRAHPFRRDQWVQLCYRLANTLLSQLDSIIAAERFAESAAWRGMIIDDTQVPAQWQVGEKGRG